MKISKIIGITMPEHVEDKLDAYLAEYLTELGRKRKSYHQEEVKQFAKLENLVMQASQSEEDAEAFLDDYAEMESGKQGDFYLYGLRDGIKFMLSIIMIR